MEYRYDIQQFKWNQKANSFYAEAPHLECFNSDGCIHPYAFPNQKQQFFIDNSKSGQSRRFRFVKEIKNRIVDTNQEFDYELIEWEFESEDKIKCLIGIN